MNSTVNYKEQSDETLVALTLMRDESAFEELVIRHRKSALLIAHTVTRNTYTAEDAVQDAFLCAWQRLDTLKDASKFGPWVCRIAKYRAINLYKEAGFAEAGRRKGFYAKPTEDALVMVCKIK